MDVDFGNMFIALIKTCVCLPVCFFFALPGSSSAVAASLQIAPVVIPGGQSFALPVNIDKVNKLAGIKVVLEYDSTCLIYEKTEKSEKTSQMMQVVNDREPGKLVVVMAAAKGISGKALGVFSVYFTSPPGIREKIITKIRVSEVELVDDELKVIPCKLSESQIMLLPEFN